METNVSSGNIIYHYILKTDANKPKIDMFMVLMPNYPCEAETTIGCKRIS
jgi:hypothetical protein